MSGHWNDRWLVPDWPAPANVRAVCTTRDGGVSLGRYQSLNLGDHVGDEPAHVARNRDLLRGAVGAHPVFLQQVHGTGVVELAHGAVRDGTAADACTATTAGLACTIMVADCLPVLFTDEAGHRVAAAHAGWRGLAGGVLEQTLKSFEGTDAAGVMAWIGPCIGPAAFEVGPEVKAAFEAHAAEAAACFRNASAPGKWLADLPALARQRLHAAGLSSVHGNDGSDGWCTVANASRFFSHRRDGVSGRFAALVWKA